MKNLISSYVYQLCTKKAKIMISELNLNLKVKYFEALRFDSILGLELKIKRIEP